MQSSDRIALLVAAIVGVMGCCCCLGSSDEGARAPAAPPAGWRVDVATSPMDDSLTVDAWLPASGVLRGWLKTERPVLHIRCRENRTDVFVWHGFATDVELGNYDKTHVRWRVDDGEAVRPNASQSTDNDALFMPNPITRAKSLIGAKVLTYEVTPFNSSPQAVTFDLAGGVSKVDDAIGQVRKACHW